jgi:antitoxin MazE
MQLNLIKIGNSKGFVLSQTLINQCGFKNVVEVELKDHCLILKASDQPRQGWDKLFQSEEKPEDDEFKDFLCLQNKWDEEEWVW